MYLPDRQNYYIFLSLSLTFCSPSLFVHILWLCFIPFYFLNFMTCHYYWMTSKIGFFRWCIHRCTCRCIAWCILLRCKKRLSKLYRCTTLCTKVMKTNHHIFNNDNARGVILNVPMFCGTLHTMGGKNFRFELANQQNPFKSNSDRMLWYILWILNFWMGKYFLFIYILAVNFVAANPTDIRRFSV